MEVQVKFLNLFINLTNHLHTHDHNLFTTKEDFLNAEFLKQFKDPGEFASFMEELYVRGTEKMLEGEIDAHLGYEKYAAEGRNTGNSRNGKTSKRLKSKYGDVEIEVPRDSRYF